MILRITLGATVGVAPQLSFMKRLPDIILRIVAAGCLVVALTGQGARAAEGSYRNYVPGTYGDFGMALAPIW